MAGFMLWIRGKWGEWRALRNRGPNEFVSNADHADFDRMIGA